MFKSPIMLIVLVAGGTLAAQHVYTMYVTQGPATAADPQSLIPQNILKQYTSTMVSFLKAMTPQPRKIRSIMLYGVDLSDPKLTGPEIEAAIVKHGGKLLPNPPGTINEFYAIPETPFGARVVHVNRMMNDWFSVTFKMPVNGYAQAHQLLTTKIFPYMQKLYGKPTFVSPRGTNDIMTQYRGSADVSIFVGNVTVPGFPGGHVEVTYKEVPQGSNVYVAEDPPKASQ